MSINQLLAKFRNGQQNVIRKTRNLPRRFVVAFFLFRSQNRFCFLFANEPVPDLWHISFWISANQMFYPQIPSTPIRLAIKFQFKLLCWSGAASLFFAANHIPFAIYRNADSRKLLGILLLNARFPWKMRNHQDIELAIKTIEMWSVSGERASIYHCNYANGLDMPSTRSRKKFTCLGHIAFTMRHVYQKTAWKGSHYIRLRKRPRLYIPVAPARWMGWRLLF